ncbi:GGDEF domain-containing protein [Neobacillus sp. 3P2-tot-E-2]|uniref:GGDEF domain-containing protein n=1 Tax=Neobacillus sp. 3P2-tot-E-2 TaxID=3132212 RepID=UPI0039A174E9
MKFHFSFGAPVVSLEKQKMLEQFLLKENIIRCKLFARIVLLFEAILIGLNLATTYQGSHGINIYLILYLTLFLMSMFMLIYIRFFGKKVASSGQGKWFRVGLLCFVNFFLVWGSVVSLVDQKDYGHIMAFVVNFMCVSILFHASNRTILQLYITPIAVLFIGLPYFQPSSTIVMGHYINLFVFLFFCWLASRMLYKNVSTNFYNKLLLTETNQSLAAKIEENEKMNSELARVNQQLKKMAIMDELTKIPNRRGFQQYIRKALSTTHGNQKLSVMMLDIDSFKSFNDHYGHFEGDKVIESVAATIQQCMDSTSSITARFGGEEFVIAGFELNEQEFNNLAESIRAAIMELKIPHAFSPVSNQVTISIGLATGNVSEEEEITQLLENADIALYKSKTNGRNRVEFFEILHAHQV